MILYYIFPVQMIVSDGNFPLGCGPGMEDHNCKLYYPCCITWNYSKDAVQVKYNVFLCLIKHHPIKMFREVKVQLHALARVGAQ